MARRLAAILATDVVGFSSLMAESEAGTLAALRAHREELFDPETGRTRVRGVDVNSTRYAIARRYMIRLRRDDFENDRELSAMAEVCGMDVPALVEVAD